MHVVTFTTHRHDRRKSIGIKTQRKEKKIKERKEKTRKREREEGKAAKDTKKLQVPGRKTTVTDTRYHPYT